MIDRFAANDLAAERWALVVLGNESTEVIRALWPLVQQRMRQLGFSRVDYDFPAKDTICSSWHGRLTEGSKRTFENSWGEIPPVLILRPGETAAAWLARHGVINGNHLPQRVPLNLLLVGRPGPLDEQDQAFIPFEFQYQLGVTYNVGRLCFSDGAGGHDLAGYAAYAAALVGHEQSTAAPRRNLAAFAVSDETNRASQLFENHFVRPLLYGEAGAAGIAARLGYQQSLLIGAEATRARLGQLLQGEAPGGPPAALLISGFCLGPSSGELAQVLERTGAIVCQDWDGFGPVKREHWFEAADLSPHTQVAGLALMLIGAYGLGVPKYSGFPRGDGPREQLAPFDFICRLPQELLRRGALGVIGHVDDLWTHSLGPTYPTPGYDSTPLQQMVELVLSGERLGRALAPLSRVYAARAALWLADLNAASYGGGGGIASAEIDKLLPARTDARNYILLGDPAARLAV